MSNWKDLEALCEKGEEILKDPVRYADTPADLVYYGTLKTDIFMAKLALDRGSQPMIEHYKHLLELQVEVANGPTQEEN